MPLQIFRTRSRYGLTLLELAVVAALLVILAGAVVPLVSRYAVVGRATAARASLVQIRNAIVGTAEEPGFLADTGQLPNTLNDLFNNPFSPANPFSAANPYGNFERDTGRGWRGPYLLNATGTYAINNATNFTVAYGHNGDITLLDPWGNPFVLQRPTVGTPEVNNTYARLISAGPNGVIDTPQDYAGTPYPPAGARGDDIVLFLNHSDSYP